MAERKLNDENLRDVLVELLGLRQQASVPTKEDIDDAITELRAKKMIAQTQINALEREIERLEKIKVQI